MMLRHLGSVQLTSVPIHVLTFLHQTRLDSIANSISSSTFGVINGGKVRTADMGGESLRAAPIMELNYVYRLSHNF